MSAVETEHVLVVPTAVFHDLGHFQGFCSDADRYLTELLQPQYVSYRPRAEMEEDPSFKQLIPYVIFQHETPDGIELFQYQRGSGQGETRLHAKRSIGVGGHVSSVDAEVGDDPYGEGLRRELEEEVQIDAPCMRRRVGLINDDETEVGRVHLGVVHIFEIEAPAVQPREDEMHNCGFHPVEQLIAEADQFETWSEICLKSLYRS